MTTNSESPAHPRPRISTYCPEDTGLTKREYFASMALQGIIASGNLIEGDSQKLLDSVAEGAVLYADALLKQLEVLK